jgi:hypothetical protein
MSLTMPPALFDLDLEEPAPAPATEEPARRPTWSTVPCNVCHEPLRRYVRQEPAIGWYQYSLDATAWEHMRAHHAGRSLITPWPFGLRVTERRPA